jgi:hypothetical protein
MEWKMETPTFEVHEAGSHGKAWSLDRRVPIALVITTAVQLLAFAWFANGPFAHPDDQDGRAVSLEVETNKAGSGGIGISDTFLRLDDTLESIHAALIRIERMLQRHPDDGQ